MTNLSAWLRNIATAAASFFGIGSILYGLGFLVLRSHYSFLGVWGGFLGNPGELTEEGGRFLHGLLFLPLGLLDSPRLLGVLLLVALALALDLAGPRLRNWADASVHASKGRRLRRRSAERAEQFRTVLLLLLLLGTAVLLETLWPVIQYENALTQDPGWGNTAQRFGLYENLVIRILVCCAIAWLLYRHFWRPAAAPVHKLLVLGQWLFTLAALASLPLAYGRLALPVALPSFQHPQAPGGSQLYLLTRTDQGWITWDTQRKETVVLPFLESAEGSVVISARRNLLP